MNDDFIDLSRRFRTFARSEIEDSDFLAELNDMAIEASMSWDDLLKRRRVLLLAEAGSGKSREMQHQKERLRAAGMAAFFVPLEALGQEELSSTFSPDDERLFERWLRAENEPAWFFLDAVDELKLVGGKLDRALTRLGRALNNHAQRSHVVVSCRPHDWRPDLDMRTLVVRLPIIETPVEDSTSSEEIFLKGVRRDGGVQSTNANSERDTEPCAVVMLPLSRRQIEAFALARGVKSPSLLVADIAAQRAWSFARRPADLLDLIDVWARTGALGTRCEQHESNLLTKLRDDPDRPDHGVLSDIKARLGAERLALALALTKSRTIRSPEQRSSTDNTDVALDASQVLSDWTERERQTLLRRGLFDPATYGRVRFHHRSVQEYLAAHRLRTLRESGMTAKALHRMLFAERYGEKIAVPSLRPMAAWLALWFPDVRKELTAREPETLLSLGDPEALSVDSRAELLRSFADAYGSGGWRGLHIPVDAVRRLAHSDLGPTIRDLWGDGPTNVDLRKLLLETIRQGAIVTCVHIAAAAAREQSFDAIHQIIAIHALIACNQNELLREIAESILAEPTLWSDELVHEAAVVLFPMIISVGELLALVKRTREPASVTSGFGWTARRLPALVEPCSERDIELRDGLTALIWNGRNSDQDGYRVEGNFDYLAPILACLVERQLSTPSHSSDGAAIRSAVIAHRFGHDEGVPRDNIEKLKSCFREGVTQREIAFWTEVEVMEELLAPTSISDGIFRATRHSVIGRNVTTKMRQPLDEFYVAFAS
jgi:hypothetical protein